MLLNFTLLPRGAPAIRALGGGHHPDRGLVTALDRGMMPVLDTVNLETHVVPASAAATEAVRQALDRAKARRGQVDS